MKSQSKLLPAISTTGKLSASVMICLVGCGLEGGRAHAQDMDAGTAISGNRLSCHPPAVLVENVLAATSTKDVQCLLNQTVCRTPNKLKLHPYYLQVQTLVRQPTEGPNTCCSLWELQ